MESKTPRIFLDVTKQQGKSSGIYVRNDLREIVERVKKEGKERVVGIVFDETYNLELITEDLPDPKIIQHPSSKKLKNK